MPRCEVFDGLLTGRVRVRAGWFGLLFAQVEVDTHDGSRIWRAARASEWDLLGFNIFPYEDVPK